MASAGIESCARRAWSPPHSQNSTCRGSRAVTSAAACLMLAQSMVARPPTALFWHLAMLAMPPVSCRYAKSNVTKRSTLQKLAAGGLGPGCRRFQRKTARAQCCRPRPFLCSCSYATPHFPTCWRSRGLEAPSGGAAGRAACSLLPVRLASLQERASGPRSTACVRNAPPAGLGSMKHLRANRHQTASASAASSARGSHARWSRAPRRATRFVSPVWSRALYCRCPGVARRWCRRRSQPRLSLRSL